MLRPGPAPSPSSDVIPRNETSIFIPQNLLSEPSTQRLMSSTRHGTSTLNTLGLPTNIDFLPLCYFFLCSSIAIFLGVFLVQKKEKRKIVFEDESNFL